MDKLMNAANCSVEDNIERGVYLIFGCEEYYPYGGCRDFKAYAKSLNDLDEILSTLNNDEIHVLNVNTMTIVATKQKGSPIEFCNIKLEDYDKQS